MALDVFIQMYLFDLFITLGSFFPIILITWHSSNYMYVNLNAF